VSPASSGSINFELSYGKGDLLENKSEPMGGGHPHRSPSSLNRPLPPACHYLAAVFLTASSNATNHNAARRPNSAWQTFSRRPKHARDRIKSADPDQYGICPPTDCPAALPPHNSPAPYHHPSSLIRQALPPSQSALGPRADRRPFTPAY